MIVSRYIPIDGKIYVAAEDYDKVLYMLKDACDKAQKNQETQIKLPDNPIDCAALIINSSVEYEPNPIQKALGANGKENVKLYSVSELREIAEHLMLYCKHNEEDKVE